MDTIEGLLCVPLALFWVFIYCHLSSRTSNQLIAFGDVAFQSCWYKYPIELRKYLTLTIARGQVRFNFSGLNIFYCNTATFATVRKHIGNHIQYIHHTFMVSETTFFVYFRLFGSFVRII